VSIKIYVEGGGDSKALKTACRRGFRLFLEKAGLTNRIAARDGWRRPHGAADDQCHLMVQIMESWFLADKVGLASFYGQGFRENALPASQEVEQIPKADVLSGLAQATRDTRKGSYSKGSHSFHILADVDLASVEDAAPHARHLLETLRAGGHT
jgi:hypothetical protein